MHPALLTVVVLFALLGHGYFWIAIVNRLHGWAAPHRLIDVLTLLVLILFLALPPLILWQWWQTGISFLDARSLGPSAEAARCYIVAVAIFGLGKLLAKIIGGWELDDPQVVVGKQRLWIVPPERNDLWIGPYARLLSYVPGNQVLKLTVDFKRLALPQLPEGIEGFRIAHVSDWHLTGRIHGAWFDHVAKTINEQDADVIILTGDLIENEDCRPWMATSIGRLQARHGVYFVLGNHDFYIDAARTIVDLERMGLVCVGGERLDVSWNGTAVQLVGNEMPWNRRLTACVPSPDSFRIAVVHTPDQFDWACVNRFHLVLAGHTHGGQVCFPILGAVAAPSLYGTRLAGGTFVRGQTVMHVTRGISGETPMRWLCPPEIAILELTQA